MMIDSGSCLNIIDEKTFRDLSLHKTVLKPCDKMLRGYGGTVIPVLGQFRDVLHSADKSITTDFVVVKGDHGNLLSGQTANTLGLLHLSRSHVNTVSDKLVKYPVLKQGIGKLNDRQIHLYIDHSIQPTCIPQHRRIPFHQRKKVEVELARLEREDIIERVVGPTPWVSPILVVRKPKSQDEVRICIDMRVPNRAIERTRHVMPTLDDLILDLSARLEKWTLRLQAYNFTIRYEPGRNNPADWMSRHPVGKCQDTTSQIDEYINFVISHTVPKAMSVEEVRQETSVDPLMQEVIKRIQLGNWNDPTDDPDLRSFRNIHAELSCLDNVVLRGTRLVLPRILQHRAVNLAHEGHQGIVKTKSLLREKVWFPGIDKMAEETVKRCIPCQATGPDPAPEPLRMSELPRGPWLVVAADFKGPYGPSNEYVLVLTDEYSRYPVTRIVRSTAAVTVIPVVDELLSMFGIPDVLKTDNGPPFNSDDFYKYSKHVGFHHRRITPEWPRANSEVERFMTNINKVVQTALIEEKTWKQELHTFLRSYRATPHTTSGRTPYELLFGRSMHVELPEFPDFPAEDFALRRRDQQAKHTQKDYSDSRRHVKASNIQPGDSVLVKRRQLNKMMSRFDPEPYEVTDVKGPMITAQSPGGHVITRNSSFMKAVPTPAEPSVPPVAERTWPSPERPGPASMARPPGAHSLSPMARPPGAPPSPLTRPPGAPPHSPLARPRWSPPGQSTHVPSPRFEPETPESSLDSGTRPPDSNQGYSLRCRASVKTPGYLKDYVPWSFND